MYTIFLLLMCVCVFVDIYLSWCIYGSQKTSFESWFSSCTLFWSRILLFLLYCEVQAGWPISFQAVLWELCVWSVLLEVCSYTYSIQSAGIAGAGQQIWLFTWVPDVKLRSSSLDSRTLTCWVISPDHCIFLLLTEKTVCLLFYCRTVLLKGIPRTSGPWKMPNK